MIPDFTLFRLAAIKTQSTRTKRMNKEDRTRAVIFGAEFTSVFVSSYFKVLVTSLWGVTRKIFTLIGLFIEQRVSMKSHDHALQLYR